MCTDVDIVNHSSQDLLSDHHWSQLKERLQRPDFSAVVAGTPCETFSHARTFPGGPPPLRSAERILGLPTLDRRQQEQVRKANLLVDRTAEAAHLILQLGGIFVLENPRPWDGAPSIFKMPSIVALREQRGGQVFELDQCAFGAEAQKPTWRLAFGVDLSRLEQRCSHPKRQWTEPGGPPIRPHTEDLRDAAGTTASGPPRR